MSRIVIAVLILAGALSTVSASPFTDRYPAVANRLPHLFRVQQRNVCACTTYANSACTGPCDFSGKPQGCFCK
jgi:hypothetical protein